MSEWLKESVEEGDQDIVTLIVGRHKGAARYASLAKKFHGKR